MKIAGQATSATMTMHILRKQTDVISECNRPRFPMWRGLELGKATNFENIRVHWQLEGCVWDFAGIGNFLWNGFFSARRLHREFGKGSSFVLNQTPGENKLRKRDSAPEEAVAMTLKTVA